MKKKESSSGLENTNKLGLLLNNNRINQDEEKDAKDYRIRFIKLCFPTYTMGTLSEDLSGFTVHSACHRVEYRWL